MKSINRIGTKQPNKTTKVGATMERMRRYSLSPNFNDDRSPNTKTMPVNPTKVIAT
ncbi:MAG: hypothetical protein O3C43_12710 [Verrucomicrobia bacterium]|nr:hypothetical protein [Verrucomicrobiota bacterium]